MKFLIVPMAIFATFFLCTCHKNSPNRQTDVSETKSEDDWKANLGSDSINWTENWIDNSSRTDSQHYKFRDGCMYFWTDAGSRQRPKITHRKRNFSTGDFFWRIYVPAMGISEKASIGAFLYYDDEHELDFEIGSGKNEVREAYRAREDEVLIYLTSQAYPFHQTIVPIKTEQWYDLGMGITETDDGKYFLKWYLNDQPLDSLKLEYGKEIAFGIHCSLENIDFIGDITPTREHYCLFEKVGFKPNS